MAPYTNIAIIHMTGNEYNNVLQVYKTHQQMFFCYKSLRDSTINNSGCNHKTLIKIPIKRGR